MEEREPLVRAYVAALAAAALLVLVVGALALRGWRPDLADAAWVAGLVAFCYALQRAGSNVGWRRQSVVMTLEELAVVLALGVLPPPVALLVALLGVLLAQLRARRGLVKSAYNVAAHVLATAAAIAAFAIATPTAPVWLAAAASALAYAATSHALLALLLGLREGTGPWSPLRTSFGRQVLVQATLAAALGAAVLGLHAVHPLAAAAALPLVLLARAHVRLHAESHRQLDVHRRLAALGRRLAGRPSVDDVADAVLQACSTLLDATGARLRLLDERGRVSREWTRSFRAGAPLPTDELVVGLPGLRGTLDVGRPRHAPHYSPIDEEVLAGIANLAATAIENAHVLERMRLLLEAEPQCVKLIDDEGRLVGMNPAGVAIVGAPLEALRGRLVEELVAPAHREAYRGFHGAALRGERPRLQFEMRTASGEARWMDSIAVRLPHQEGAAVLCVTRDITEQKRAEEEAEAARVTAMRAEKLSSLGTLIAGVAHEINNPLTWMQGYAEMNVAEMEELRRRAPLDPDAMRAVEEDIARQRKIIVGLDQIGALTRSLKRVARSDGGERTDQEVNPIVEHVLTVVRPRLWDGVRVRVDLGARTRVAVNGGEASQVLLNLVLNATQALAGRPGVVQVRTFDAGGQVVVEVEDDGPGIPAEAHAKLFEPFYTTKPGGTGLGLSISHRIARDHGGDLTFRSAPGCTVFRWSIPAAPTETEAKAKAKAGASA